jgi:hypothetical protein
MNGVHCVYGSKLINFIGKLRKKIGRFIFDLCGAVNCFKKVNDSVRYVKRTQNLRNELGAIIQFLFKSEVSTHGILKTQNRQNMVYLI